jgi:uncharacterized YigZ family protein
VNEAAIYYTIEKTGTAEFKDRGSKFIAYAYPVSTVEEFKQRLEEVKKEHPKATHHCFAYRLGTDKNNFRSSDDGEPSGTAGKPILGQIDSQQLTNTLIVVVRYFGGTQLGVPGLINAYRTSAALVLQVIPAVQKSIEINYLLQFDYTQMNEVMMVVKKYNCTIIQQQMNLFCQLKLGIPKSRLNEAVYAFNEIRNIEIKPV